MIITVTHLTRMEPGYVCVAGVDPATQRHVRPVMQGRLSVHLVASRGGPFNMGEIVDLGAVRHVGRAPEFEDHQFDWRQTRVLATAQPAELCEVVRGQCDASLGEIFGPELRPHARGYVIEQGGGKASLGCLLPECTPRLFINQRGRVRMSLWDDGNELDVSVTDLRLCDARYRPDARRVASVQQRMSRGVPVVLCVGITRPHRRAEEPAYHWLQVNNIHLADDPGWRLPSGPAGWREDDDSLF